MRSLSDVLREVDAFFMGASAVHAAAARITDALTELQIPCALTGTLAMNAHGYTHTTDIVELLLTPQGLASFKERWLGRGWIEQFPGSKGIRDAVNEVNIDVLLTGDYPGDGHPKPVAFPDPADAQQRDEDGRPILPLRVLITLKLASGMTAPHRPRDLDDVIQLIRRNALDRAYAERLDPYVRAKYLEMWEAAQVRDEY